MHHAEPSPCRAIISWELAAPSAHGHQFCMQPKQHICLCCKAEKKKPGDAFLASGRTGQQEAAPAAAQPVLQPSTPTSAKLGSSTPDPGDAEKYESIVALSDRRALRKVILPCMCNNIYQMGFADPCALPMCWSALHACLSGKVRHV